MAITTTSRSPPFARRPRSASGDSLTQFSGEMSTFRIKLRDPAKLQRKWPPSPFVLFAVSVPLLLYPVWVVLLMEYREKREDLPPMVSLVLDEFAKWILDYAPVLAVTLLASLIVACLGFLGMWHLGIVRRD